MILRDKYSPHSRSWRRDVEYSYFLVNRMFSIKRNGFILVHVTDCLCWSENLSVE